jgi:hypothetical protein
MNCVPPEVEEGHNVERVRKDSHYHDYTESKSLDSTGRRKTTTTRRRRMWWWKKKRDKRKLALVLWVVEVVVVLFLVEA